MIDRVVVRAPLRPDGAPLLQVEELCVRYGRGRSAVRAVERCSLTLRNGEIFGAFGESRAGKSTLAHALSGLLERGGWIAGGQIFFDGRELARERRGVVRALCGQRIAIVPTHPAASFDPALTIAAQMTEAWIVRWRMRASEAHDRVQRALAAIGIAHEVVDAYPHELDAALLTRIGVAMALQHGPALVIADDPTRDLDLTQRRDVVQDVLQCVDVSGATVVWLTRDIALLNDIATRLAILYAGRVVEEGSTKDVLERPAHPYTRSVLASLPSRATRGVRLRAASGAVPSAGALPVGCAFRERCGQPLHACIAEPAARFVQGAQRDHVVRCHRPHETVDL